MLCAGGDSRRRRPMRSVVAGSFLAVVIRDASKEAASTRGWVGRTGPRRCARDERGDGEGGRDAAGDGGLDGQC